MQAECVREALTEPATSTSLTDPNKRLMADCIVGIRQAKAREAGQNVKVAGPPNVLQLTELHRSQAGRDAVACQVIALGGPGLAA